MAYCAYCGSPVNSVSYAPCPKCGNPTNGAPRPVATAAAGGNNALVIVVVAVVGGLVLIAIIGIIAAIAIPNLLTATQRSKQRRTIADIRTLATAAEAYGTDLHEYPRSLDVLKPTYLRTIPTLDGWGNRLEYECLADESGKCTGYAIGSRAKDGRLESGGLHESVSQPRGPTTNFDCDIIFSNGTFVEYPEGVAR